MAFNEFLQRDAHLFFNSDGVVDVTADAEQLRALILWSSKTAKPAGPSAHDRWADCYRLDVSDCRRAAIKTCVSREGRLQSGATGFAFNALNKTSLFTTNVCSSTTMDIDIKVIAATAGVFAQEALIVGLVHGFLELVNLVPELAADVNVCSLSAH